MRKFFGGLILAAIAVGFALVCLGVGTYDIYKCHPSGQIHEIRDWRGNKIPLANLDTKNLTGEVHWVSDELCVAPPQK